MPEHLESRSRSWSGIQAPRPIIPSNLSKQVKGWATSGTARLHRARSRPLFGENVMDDIVAALLEASRILNNADVPSKGRCVIVSSRTYHLFRDKRYRGRMIRRGKMTKREASFYA